MNQPYHYGVCTCTLHLHKNITALNFIILNSTSGSSIGYLTISYSLLHRVQVCYYNVLALHFEDLSLVYKSSIYLLFRDLLLLCSSFTTTTYSLKILYYSVTTLLLFHDFLPSI